MESLLTWIQDITNGNLELARGASGVASLMLLKTSGSESWQSMTNIHSTVKPIALMQYLIKMVTRQGGTVLDPFMGSGTTGIACANDGFGFIGIELDESYFKIAEARIKAARDEFALFGGIK